MPNAVPKLKRGKKTDFCWGCLSLNYLMQCMEAIAGMLWVVFVHKRFQRVTTNRGYIARHKSLAISSQVHDMGSHARVKLFDLSTSSRYREFFCPIFRRRENLVSIWKNIFVWLLFFPNLCFKL